jgi:ribokinase
MIVVFGSINLDLFVRVERLPAPGETVLGPRLEMAPGGKGANQALAAKRAGAAEVRLIGRVGRDAFAAPALELLRAGGVDLGRVEPGDEPTGCACIAIDRQGRNQIVVASGANRRVAEAQVPDDWLGPGTVLVLQLEIPLGENWALIRRARAAGARIVLNAAPAAPAPAEALAALDVLIVNEVEALALAQGLGVEAAEAPDAGRALARRTGVAVVVTLGDAGAAALARAGGAAGGHRGCRRRLRGRLCRRARPRPRVRAGAAACRRRRFAGLHGGRRAAEPARRRGDRGAARRAAADTAVRCVMSVS